MEWRDCFICSQRFVAIENTAKLSRYKILLQFLLNCPRDASLLDKILKEPENTGTAEPRICGKCAVQFEEARQLYTDLEVVQMKLIDKLKLLRTKIINQHAVQDKDRRKNQGPLPISSVGGMESIMDAFYAAVYAKGNDVLDIPFVFLKAYAPQASVVVKSELETAEEPVPSTRSRKRRKIGSLGPSDSDESADEKEDNVSVSTDNFACDSNYEPESGDDVVIKNELPDLEDPPPPLRLGRRGVPQTKADYDSVFQALRADPSTNLYQCPSCEVTHNRKFNLYVHYKKAHFNQSILACSWSNCSKTFRTRQSYQVHMDRHNETPRRKCDLCDLVFYSAAERTSHREQDHENGKVRRQFGCHFCGNRYVDRRSLNSHRRRVHSKLKNRGQNAESGSEPSSISDSSKKVTSSGTARDSLSTGPELLTENSSPPEENQEADPLLELPPPPPPPPVGKTKTDYDPVFEALRADPSTNLYHCPSCEATNTRKFNLYIHYKKAHFNESLLGCSWPNCSKTFLQRQNYQIHMDHHYKTPRWKCDLCDLVFYSPQERTSHRQREHEQGKLHRHFICERCNKGFPDAHSLVDHRRKKHPDWKINRPKTIKRPVSDYGVINTVPALDGKFKCPSCDYTAPTTAGRKLLYHHYKTKHLKEKYSCTWPNCTVEFLTEVSLKGHLDQHKGTPRFACPDCPEMFYSRIARDIHREKAHGSGRVCDECGKVFSTGHQLYVHKRTKHRGIVSKAPAKLLRNRSILCPHCGKSILEKYMTSHIKVHHSERSFVCGECPASYHSEEDLTRHRITKHGATDANLFGCNVRSCMQFFRTREKFDAHMEAIHGPGKDRPFKCRYCEKSFFQRSHLKPHELVHENRESRPYPCELCGLRFFIGNQLRQHLTRVHKLGKEEKMKMVEKIDKERELKTGSAK